MNWTRNGNDLYLTVGECTASILITGTRNRATLSATVRTPLFPVQRCDDFRTHAEAKVWCEQWIGFAVELLELRKTVATLRMQAQQDFTEIMTLRNELHNYRYPHAAESEVTR